MSVNPAHVDEPAPSTSDVTVSGDPVGASAPNAVDPTDLEAAIPVGEATTEASADAHHKKAAPQLQDQTNLLPGRQVAMVFLGLSCAALVSMLDQTIVTTAIPQISNDFNSGRQGVWIGTAYLITSTVLQPSYGRFSDIFGRKNLLLFSLVIFALGSILCAIAKTMTELIIFRAITGIGAGGIGTMVFIIISDIVSLQERGKYQGILGAVAVLGNTAGPLIGGAFTSDVTWRWCFWLSVPVSGFAIIVVFFLLPLKPITGEMKTKLKMVDYYGTITSLGATMGLLLPLSWGGTSYAWDSAAVIVPFVLSAVFFVAFLLVEWKVAVLPNIPLGMFLNSTVAGVQIGTFLLGCGFFTTIYYIPQYYQVVMGDSPIRSGVLILPLILTQLIFNIASGYLISKTGRYRVIIWAGFAVWTVGLGLLSTLSPSTSLAKQVGYMIITGLGAAVVSQNTLIAAQAAVPRSQMAVVTSTRTFLRQLGGVVALTVCEALLNNTVKLRLQQAGFSEDLVSSIAADPTTYVNFSLTQAQIATIRDAFAEGIRNTFRFAFPCEAVAFVVSVLMIKHYALKRGDEKELKAKAKEELAARQHRHAHKTTNDVEHGASALEPAEGPSSIPHDNEKIMSSPEPEASTGNQALETEAPELSTSGNEVPTEKVA